MIDFSLERRPQRRSDVWVRRSGEENVLVRRDSGSVHFLNETALAIWDLCDGDNHLKEMIVAICQLCRVHRDMVTEDVERILDEFERAGLIVWVA